MEYKKMEKKQLEIENFLTVVPFKKYNYSTILIIFYFFLFWTVWPAEERLPVKNGTVGRNPRLLRNFI